MNQDRHSISPMSLEQKITKATKTQETHLRFLRCLLLISVFAFCILHFAFSLRAQPPAQTENRFLFIINTSSAMRRMTNGIQEAVLGLLQSQMQGQMRDGDTFGIWTYDDQLHANSGVQVWSKTNQAAILGNVSNWLADRPYQKKPRLEKVLPVALQIVARSRVVTLIFIFDGSETMQGTGFDQDINALQKDLGPRMRADRIPFVTVLAARDGKFFDYRVRTPASISLPQTAGFFPPAQTNTVATVAATNVPPPVVAATNVPPPVVVPKPPETRRPEIVLRPTSPPRTNPPPAGVSAPPAQSAPEKTEAVLQPAPMPVQTPSNAVVAPNPNLNPNPNPTTPPIVAQEPLPPVKPVAKADSPLPAVSPESLPPQPAPPPVATAVVTPSSADHLALLVIASSLLIIAGVLLVFLIRRSRTPPSLISQSMDRPQ